MLLRREGRALDLRTVARFLIRGTRRMAVTVVGFTLVAVGLAGLLLPILPGWALIIAGCLVLSREYAWAYTALCFCRRQAARSGAKMRSVAGQVRRRRIVLLPPDDREIDLTQSAEADLAEESLEQSERTA